MVEHGGGGASVPLSLNNPDGKVRFVLASSGEGWTFDNVEGRSFDISRIGTGSPELRLFANGDLTIDGTLTERSERASKANVERVVPQRVLDRLEKIELARWTYNDGKGRHLGPMAGDFYRTFGLGRDAKHIAPKDLAGVAMASAKALKNDTEALDRRIRATAQELRKRLETKEERIAAQRKRIDKLETRVKELSDMLGRLAKQVEAGDEQVAQAR